MQTTPDPRSLYLDLLKKSLTGMIYQDPSDYSPSIGGYVTQDYIKKFRELGADIPRQAPSMIGLHRMNNIQTCIEQVLAEDIPGDLKETGVWRGGAVIFMRGVLKAYGVTDRTVWAADSFEGLPAPDTDHYPEDASWQSKTGWIAESLETVQHNFDLYGLLDEQVRFLKGWFKDTLPSAPVEKLAVLRLDGDLYESTTQALTFLYPRLVPGGFLIIDDYNLSTCFNAVADYRRCCQISEPIQKIHGFGAFWRRER